MARNAVTIEALVVLRLRDATVDNLPSICWEARNCLMMGVVCVRVIVCVQVVLDTILCTLCGMWMYYHFFMHHNNNNNTTPHPSS